MDLFAEIDQLLKETDEELAKLKEKKAENFKSMNERHAMLYDNIQHMNDQIDSNLSDDNSDELDKFINDLDRLLVE